MATKFRVVLVAVPSQKVAQALARGLVEEKLAACVNIVPAVQSVYRWKGKLEQSEEALLIIKTQRAQVDPLIGYVLEHHPHEVPEVLTLPVMEGNRSYLDWVGAQTNPAKPIDELPETALDPEVL